MSKKISLHETRRARIKLNILKSALELIGSGAFDELFVGQICERAEVSRVTFFKYFPKKEDLLVYFMSLWSLEWAVQQARSPKRGLAAIYSLFGKAADYQNKPGSFLSLIGSIARLSTPPRQPEITAAERRILYPDYPEAMDFKILGLNDIFAAHLAEAREIGEIETEEAGEEMIEILFTVFYGAPLAVHIRSRSDLMTS
ncbi:MAG: TetR/AcrR family transcriptional regulator, partial [Spirochaetaceae bacterium]